MDTIDKSGMLVSITDERITTANEQPASTTQATPVASSSSVAAPPGFEIVTVRKPDGSIVKVKRAIGSSSASSAAAATFTNTPAATETAKTIAAISSPQIKYQIVKVRKSDGTIVQAKRPIPADTTINAAPKSMPEPTPSTLKPVADAQPTNTPTGDSIAKPTAPQGNLSTQSDTKPKTSTTSQTSVQTRAQTYRIASKIGRLHNSVARVIGTFDPDYDLYGDVEDGDEFLSDVDDDADDDDDDVYSDADEDNEDHDASQHQDDSGNKNSVSNGGSSTSHANTKVTGSNIGRTVAQAVSTMPPKPQFTVGPPQAEQKKDETGVTEKEVQDDSEDGSKKPVRPVGRDLHRRTSRIMSIIIWSIMIIFPVLYLVLGILTAVLNSKGITQRLSNVNISNKLGEGVEQAIKIAVSAWPIIFAAVAAQTLKAFATYRVERGVKLMTLEQLISSHSLAGAVKQPFFLRRIDLTSIALLCLWALSPLASQAMLRMLSTGASSDLGTVSVYYVNTTTAENAMFSEAALTSGSFDNQVNSLFGAALLPVSPNEEFSLDPYDYPQIPNIKYLLSDPLANKFVEKNSDGSYSEVGGYGFYTTPDLEFSSFYGIPVSGLNNNVSTKFNMSSSYIEFNCLFWNLTTMAEINATGVVLKKARSSELYMKIMPPTIGSDGVLWYASMLNNYTVGDALYTYSVCNLTQRYVDSLIRCPGKSGCAAFNVSFTPNPPLTPTNMSTRMDEVFLNASTMNIALGVDDAITSLETFIIDPVNGSVEDIGKNAPMDNMTLFEFEKRLSFVFNTLWGLGFAPGSQTGNFNADAASNTSGWTEIAAADGKTISNMTIYLVNWGWLAVLFISSAVLLLAAVSFIFWDLNTIAPDILGFASSIVRHSKYVNLPKGDSTTTGAERARLLGDLEVMMQDVRPNSEVGRIALGTVRENAVRLQTGRTYR